MLRIITSRACSGKTTFITNEIFNNIENGKLSYLMVPEQLTLETERMLLDLSNKALFLCKIMSFDRFSAEVLSRVGGLKKEYIDDVGKMLLVENILLENKEDFIVYKNSINKTGFIENIVKILSDFKKNDLNTDELLNFSNTVNDRFLSQKIKEILKINELMEKKISGKFIDNESRLNLLCEKIDSYVKLKQFNMYFDNFVSFTTLELNVIEKLLQNDIDICISLLYEDGEDSSFYTTKYTLDTLIKIACNTNSKYEILNLSKSYNEVDDLKHLERNFGKNLYEKYTDTVKNIKIKKSDTAKDEIREVAREITKLIREDGYRYKDIGIVATEAIAYSKLIKEVFEVYGIPYFIDIKREVSQENIIKLVLSFIDMFVSSPNYTNIMSFFKSGLSDVAKDDYEIFENYLINWNMDSKKYLSEKIFDKEEYFKDGFEEEKEKILYVRKYIKDIYDRYKNEFKISKKSKENTARRFSRAIDDFLQELNCHQKLENTIEKLRQKSKYELASEISQIWNLLLSTLEKINTVLEGCYTEPAMYKKMLYQGLNMQKIAVIPATVDKVTVMDIKRSKAIGYKAMFIVGMNDTLAPGINNPDIVFSDKDKKLFIDSNININTTSENLLYQEKTAFYSMLSKAKEKLYLSYAISDVNYQSCGKSPYINIIENIFTNLKTVRTEKDYKDYITHKELFSSFITQMSVNKDKCYDEDIMKLYKYFSNHEDFKNTLSIITKAIFIKNNIKQIEEVGKIYNLPLKSSISQIQTYVKCPFLHYINYALRPQKRKRQVIDNVNSGNILHKYMEMFSKEILSNEEILSLNTKEEINNLVDRVYEQDDFLDSSMKNLTYESKRQKNILRNLKKISNKVTDIIIKQQQNSSFKISSYEKKIDDIEIKLDSKEIGKDKLILRGYIDRVDELKKEGKTYVGVVDYKSSIKKLELKDIYQGINLQMIFYLYALTHMEDEKEPYYALYFPMIDKKIAVSEENAENYDKIKDRQKEEMRMAGIISDDANMIKEFENDINRRLEEIISKKKANSKSAAKVNSKYINLTLVNDKEGCSLSGQSVISESHIKLIINHIIEIIKTSANEILSGNICPNPVKDSCEYCDYKNICAFDESIEGYAYKKTDNISKQDVINKLT